jgi:hypothetical protein
VTKRDRFSVAYAIAYIRKFSEQHNCSLLAAARNFRKNRPSEALAAIEEIGNWPSSEPELRALQEVWK